ncbi:ankyrin repeat domain-containing protein [Larkinella sp. C7]|uniref:ankyrin repeat domain-containing protein n=1 Tax=Larkinella sp. C7 TaxID=2576607 RepID=UPI001486B2D1|nr:ankyrin repeat domain-containing protein [Larkinella sp. C7]
MKIITTTNWIFIGIYGALVIFTLMTVNRSGNDAAGRGMESGLAIFATLVLAGLIVLNLLPYRFAKITTLIVLTLPAVFGLYNGISNYFELQKQRKDALAVENGSFYFPDVERQQIAAAVAVGDVEQVKMLLQKTPRQLNQSGYQSTTLLDFAAMTAVRSQNPQRILQCLELLMEHGATVQGPDSLHLPTQFLICETGSPALLEWFLAKGVDPNERPHDGSPLLFKVMDLDVERLEKVKVLLDHGADPNAPAGRNEYTIRPFTSPLMYAAQRQSWTICQLLLERGADPDYRTPEGEDLKTVLAKFEEPYTDRKSLPADYQAFKTFLNTKGAKKSS